MPDIKTALSAALLRAPVQNLVQTTINQWDDEEGGGFPINNSVQTKPVPTTAQPIKGLADARISSNVMRATFAFIQHNPGLTSRRICELMEASGFKRGSVVSVISQLYRSGQLHKDDMTYRTVTSEYMPVGVSPVTRLNKLKKQVETLKEVAKSRGIAALPASTKAPAPAPAFSALELAITEQSAKPPSSKFIIRQTDFSAKEHIDKLSVYQAREVYAELKTMFGG